MLELLYVIVFALVVGAAAYWLVGGDFRDFFGKD